MQLTLLNSHEVGIAVVYSGIKPDPFFFTSFVIVNEQRYKIYTRSDTKSSNSDGKQYLITASCIIQDS